MIHPPAVLMAKLSLLFLYLRIFRPNVRLRYFIYFGIAFNLLCYLSLMVGFFIIYMPRKRESMFTVLDKTRNRAGIGLAITLGAVNIVTDFYILFLPIPAVWQLQAPFGTKIGISAVFLTGIL